MESFDGRQAFVSWSGGKDCCFACYQAIKAGMDIQYLASIINVNGGSRKALPHRLSPRVLNMQAQAIGIPMLQWPAIVPNYDAYDTEFTNMLLALKQRGVAVGVFGDVNIGNREAGLHRTWINGVCQPVGITPCLPLWGLTRQEVIGSLIDSGFEVIILVADNSWLGKEWLGRKLDKDLLSELKQRYELSPTGEVGYYHTFVIDGPIFKKRLEILETNKVFIDDEWGSNWYLDILECELKPKKDSRLHIEEIKTN